MATALPWGTVRCGRASSDFARINCASRRTPGRVTKRLAGVPEKKASAVWLLRARKRRAGASSADEVDPGGWLTCLRGQGPPPASACPPHEHQGRGMWRRNGSACGFSAASVPRAVHGGPALRPQGRLVRSNAPWTQAAWFLTECQMVYAVRLRDPATKPEARRNAATAAEASALRRSFLHRCHRAGARSS